MGCVKCRLELETGEKTRKTHADYCPRKWRAAGRAPAGTPSLAAVRGKGRSGSAASMPLPSLEAAKSLLAQSKAPSGKAAVGKSKKRTRDQMLVDTATSATTIASSATTNITTEEEDEEDAVAAIGALAEATREEQEENEEERLLLSGEDEEEEDDDDDIEANLLRGGGQIFEAEDVKVKSEELPLSTEAMQTMQEEEELSDFLRGGGLLPGGEDEKDEAAFNSMEEVNADEIPSGMNILKDESGGINYKEMTTDEEPARPLRGGGRTKNAPVKKEESNEVTTDAAAAPTAVLSIQKPSPSSPTINSGASTPNRELEILSAIPTPLKLAAEHELTYSNYGRVQRSRKKPAIFEPMVGADREWSSPPGKRPRIVGSGVGTSIEGNSGGDTQEEAFKTDGPEPLRGGARPKKEESATAYESSPSQGTAKRGPGRPPSKHTKNTVVSTDSKKQNAKRAPIKKKETNPHISGVGILNRKPGSLFDCPVCLDIGKIKLCCYCACRICFNKFGKEQTILCDKCDQEYHTFCLGLDGIPDEEWECPACIEDEKKKKLAEQRKKEREAKKKAEEDKKLEEEEAKRVAAAKRRAAYNERKRAEEERKNAALEKRKVVYEKRRKKEAETRAAKKKEKKEAEERAASLAAAAPTKTKDPVVVATDLITRKRGPGRPPKSETLARMQAQLLLQQQAAAAATEGGQQPPIKRGRGRPRKDGSAPIPRKLPAKSEISTSNVYIDAPDFAVERSRSGRKIQRTVFHDEVDGGGLMKRARTDSEVAAALAVQPLQHHSTRHAGMYVAERSAAAAAKSAIASSSSKAPGAVGTKKEPRRKPGARECMQMSRKFNTGVIEQKYFDVLMDYSKRGKVDHLIRMRERMDEHSRFLEAQLAGLEALVKEKGEWNGKPPPRVRHVEVEIGKI